MLLVLIICQLSVLVAANPFHKYPFIFLLDVGNEDLEKTNPEQIRVSIPGGSVALRYPAIGDGNTISHVRVSGIDFGTDIKANIVDGGPSFKYVVLVFMGNPGVPFDVVVTVNTMVDSVINTQNIGPYVNGAISGYQNEEDTNNSAEDLNDEEVSNDVQSDVYVQNSNAELMQSSSNVYSYANNEPLDDCDGDDFEPGEESDSSNGDKEVRDNSAYLDEQFNEELENKGEFHGANNEKDIHVQYADNINEDPSAQSEKDIDDAGDDNNDDEDDNNDDVGDEIGTKGKEYSSIDSAKPVIVDSNMYTNYEALKDHLIHQGNVYSQEEFKNSRPVYQEDPIDYEDPDGVGPEYEDEVSNNRDKFRDSNNNNYIDSDESYAVAY